MSYVLLGGLCMALCLACVTPLAVAGWMRSSLGPRGYVADVCVGVRQVQRTQIAIGWISAQASASIARPSPYYWQAGTSVCAFVPWTPMLREQGGIVFPSS